MSGDLADPSGLPPWQPPGKLSALGHPSHELLANFVRYCSTDPDTRTVAITAMVLGLWQLKGCRLTPHVPSLLLANAGESGDDPVDAFTMGLVCDEAANRPGVRTSGAFTCEPVERAPEAMRSAVAKRRALGATPGDAEAAGHLEERFWAAQATGFGHGGSRPYSDAWHAEFGWLTDRGGEVILRLNGEADRAAFVADVLDDPGKLVFPPGIGSDLSAAPKGICMSGSLPAGLCSGELAASIVALGLPLLLLPHAAGEPLAEDRLAAMGGLAKIWVHEPAVPVLPSLRTPISPSTQAHEAALRRRLASLPATYEFAVMQAVHQLDGVCDRIASYAGGRQARMEEVVALCHDLYGHTLRGIAISIAGLSYFERGLYLGAGCEPLRAKAIKLLRHLREQGPVPCSLLLRNLHLKKAERDALLDHLGGECLVKVEGGMAAATSYMEFTVGLYAREELSLAEDRPAG